MKKKILFLFFVILLCSPAYAILGFKDPRIINNYQTITGNSSNSSFNGTISCSNVTGAVSDLCTVTSGSGTSSGFSNLSSIIQSNGQPVIINGGGLQMFDTVGSNQLSLNSTSSAVGMKIITTHANTGNRNWMFNLGCITYGDFCLRVSSTKDGDPNTNYIVPIYFSRAGYVGINNNTNPTSRLDVHGSATTDAIYSEQGLNIDIVNAPIKANGTVIAGGGNLSTGNYVYYITYTTALGETSFGVSSGNIAVTSGGAVNLTIPISSDIRVTGRKIYRNSQSVGDPTLFYFLKTIADTTTTSFYDAINDSLLSGGGRANYKSNTASKQITIDGTSAMTIDGQMTTLGLFAGNTNSLEAGSDVFIGDSCGSKIKNGPFNACGGSTACRDLENGTGNAVWGRGAYIIGQGDYASCMGYNACAGATTADALTAVGKNTGRAITTGSDNSFFGNGAGNGAGQNATVTGTTAIGVGATTTKSFQVVIGGTGVTETLLRGKVGIKTSVVNDALVVNGSIDATSYKTNGTDYAEILQKLNFAENLTYGDVVCILDGMKVTKVQSTTSCIKRAVVSGRSAGFIGGEIRNLKQDCKNITTYYRIDHEEDGTFEMIEREETECQMTDDFTNSNYVPVAFVGQIRVKVTGSVTSGQWIIAPTSGSTGYGTAVTIIANNFLDSSLRKVCVAGETNTSIGNKQINCIVGMG